MGEPTISSCVTITGSSISAIEDELLCIICSDLVVEAVRTSCCHRIFCSGCIAKWIERGTLGFHTCPNCRFRIGKSNLAIDDEIEVRSASQIRSCPYKQNFACTFKGARSEVDAHKEICCRANYAKLISAMFADIKDGAAEARESAIQSISNILSNNIDLHNQLIEAGVIPVLISMLAVGQEPIIGAALSSLGTLAKEATYKSLLMDNEVVIPLIQIIDRATGEQVVDAMLLLSKLAIFNKDHQTIIGDAGALVPLIRQLKTAHDSGRYHAAGAIWNICSKHAVNQLRAAEAGVFPPLVELMVNHPMGFNVNAAGAIWNILATSDANNNVAISSADILRLFVQLLDGEPAENVKSFVATSLETLCSSTETNYTPIIEAGVVPYLIAFAAADDPGRQKSAAFVLARLLTISAQVRADMVTQGVISTLIGLLASESQLEVTLVHALQALTELAMDSTEGAAYCESIVEHGAMACFSQLLSTEAAEFLQPALTLLECLLKASRNAREFIAEKVERLEPIVIAILDPQLCACALNILRTIAKGCIDAHDNIAHAEGIFVLREVLRSEEATLELRSAAAATLRVLSVTPVCRQLITARVLAEIETL